MRCLFVLALSVPAVSCFSSKTVPAPTGTTSVVFDKRTRFARRSKAVAFGGAITEGNNRGEGLTGRISRLCKSYSKKLNRKPLVTKSVTSAVVSGLGDIFAQWLEAHAAGNGFTLDFARFGGFTLVGGLYVGPFFELWYSQLWKLGRWMERHHALSKRLQTIAQVFVDQTVGVALFFPPYFYVYEAFESLMALRVPVMANAYLNLKEQIASVLLMQYYIWPLANWINFAYVPENLRVLVSNVVAVFWNALLCTLVA